ncbi:hypothetical protein ACS2TZ_14225 [Bacillus cereus group sp. Bce025]|nr:hypothetical protein [Bacillus cereus]MDA2497412.1 hypothetical protein [Bacillus cereus]
MSNWLFALCMIVVASVLNVIVSFFIKGGKLLKESRKKIEGGKTHRV